MLIKVKNTREIRRYVPGYVFQQSPFKFLPLGFTILTKGETQELMYPRNVQEAGFNKFCEQPFGGQNYIITGYLDDSKALYLAAYLLQKHLEKGGKHPLWVQLNSSFKEQVQEITKPSMLVISNLTTESSAIRFEKCRDLTLKYWDIPKIIVGCGMDPVRFGGMRLHVPVNKMVYFKSGLDVETATIE